MRHLQEILSNFTQKSLVEKARLSDAYLIEKLAADLAEIHNLYDLAQFRKLLAQTFQAADRKIDDNINNLISNKASAIIAIPDQWPSIPYDKLWLIIQHLTPREFWLLGKVNRQFRSLSQSDFFWQQYAKLYKINAENKKDFAKRYIILFGKTSNEIDNFIYAIANNDEETVAALLPYKVIQAYLKDKFILLFTFVASNSNLAILRVLETYLASSHDIVKDIIKLIALENALKAGHKENCAYLRNSLSSSPITQNLDRELFKNPLHLAAASGDLNSLTYYIGKGFSVNNIVGDYTPLHMAVLSGQQATIERLLEHGAEINFETTNFDTALSLSLLMGHDSLAKFLLERGAVLSTKANESVLKLAVLFGCEKTICYLREKGHDISSLDEHGNSYLHQAALASHNSANVVSRFIGYGLAVNQKNKAGRTPLHYAASRGHAGAVRELLYNNADIHCCDSNNETALHYAARSGDKETVELLLADNLSAIQPNKVNETPIQLAVQAGHKAVVQLLLDSIKFQVQTSRQRRHAACEKMQVVLNSEKEIFEAFNAFLHEEIQHAPMSLVEDIADFKVQLNNDKKFNALNWYKGMRQMLVKRLLSASSECFNEYRKVLPKRANPTNEQEINLEQALQNLDFAIQEMQEKNRQGKLPHDLAAAFYQLTYVITDPQKRPQEKIAAIDAFKAKILPSWWQTFGRILACIFFVAIGICLGFSIGFWAIAGCAWSGILNLSTVSTFASNIILGSWVASTAIGGISAGVISSFCFFKATPEEKMAKRLAKDANSLIDTLTSDPKLLTQPLNQQAISTLIP